jgi:hypothetical protein
MSFWDPIYFTLQYRVAAHFMDRELPKKMAKER